MSEAKEIADEILSPTAGGRRSHSEIVLARAYLDLLLDVVERTTERDDTVKDRNRLAGELKALREEVNAKYWEAIRADNTRLRYSLKLHDAKATGNYWCWQGDEEDHPESLTCPVLIPIDTLRPMLSAQDRVQELERVLGDVQEQGHRWPRRTDTGGSCSNSERYTISHGQVWGWDRLMRKVDAALAATRKVQ